MMHDQETVLLQGHIIDSLILAKVLDTILMMGGTFDIQDMQIGKTREEPSRARIVVRASSAKLLSEILHAIQPHGASVESERDCRLSAAPADGIFPDEFYATTHLPTQVRVHDEWVEVEGIEMDLGIRVDPVRLSARTADAGSISARARAMIITAFNTLVCFFFIFIPPIFLLVWHISMLIFI